VFSSPLRRNHGALLASLTNSAPVPVLTLLGIDHPIEDFTWSFRGDCPPGATLVSDMYNDEPRPADDGSLAGWIYYVDSHYCAAIPLLALRPDHERTDSPYAAALRALANEKLTPLN
jgi:hypothetical protein